MGRSVTFLKNLYQATHPIFFITALFALFIPYTNREKMLNFYTISLITVALTFSAGLALTEVSQGFALSAGLYGLPM